MSLSIRTHIVRRLLPFFLPDSSMTPREQRQRVDRFAGRVGKGIVVEEASLGGITGTRVRAEGARPDQQLLHFHGGGFVVGSSRTFLTMLGELARRTGTVATSVDYRLAPEHPWPAAVDDCFAAYRALLEDVPPELVALVGESAGGNAVLSTMIRARDEGLRLPAAAVVFSPWTDLTFSGPSIVGNRATEVVLDPDLFRSWRDGYVAGAEAHDPAISPLFADLSGLPPLHVQIATGEILEDDGRRLADRAQAAGVDVDLVAFDGLWHVFQTQAPLVPEASEALDRAAAFLRRSANFVTP